MEWETLSGNETSNIFFWGGGGNRVKTVSRCRNTSFAVQVHQVSTPLKGLGSTHTKTFLTHPFAPQGFKKRQLCMNTGQGSDIYPPSPLSSDWLYS